MCESTSLQGFLDTLNTATVVEAESTFFADWENRAAKSYVELTFESRQSTGSVFVTVDVFHAGVLLATAVFNSATAWDYYNFDGSWNVDTPALIVIGSACSTQPVVVEPLVTSLPFALRT